MNPPPEPKSAYTRVRNDAMKRATKSFAQIGEAFKALDVEGFKPLGHLSENGIER